MGASVLRAILVAAVLLVPASLSAQPGRFRTGVELVTVGVTVLDDEGRVVRNLSVGDFELYEEGKRQEIAYFARGDQKGSNDDLQNLRLGLLFDTSGSMDRDIRFSRTAAVRFLNKLQEAVDITLVDFDTEVRIARFEQASFPLLVARIRERKPEGWTALYDALGTYLDGSYELNGRKILVLYSDGGDTRSTLTYSEAIDMLKASDVTVFALGFLENQPSTTRATQRMRLMQMAEVTGGQAYFPTSLEALDEIYHRIAMQIRSQYSLGFIPTPAREPGEWRRLEVRLTGQRKGYKVRARPGYYAAPSGNP
ncbi:MAG TPA: VWA domain-containing protein [Vicinamibacterales bacterium]|nr:VWA domain-containing protein [Vicinamibacterales bacterium]